MRIVATTLFIVAVGIGPVLAKAGAPGKPAGPRPPKAAHVAGGPAKGPTHQRAPKITGTGTARAKGPARTTSAGPKHGKTTAGTTRTSPAQARNSHGAKSSSKVASAAAPASTSSMSRKPKSPSKTQVEASSGASNTTSIVTVTGPNVPKNPKLQAKLLAMLPPGTTLNDAAAGFKNQGQFVAAVHVSNNLGVPFTELRTRMVDQGLSLGQAIQMVRPMANNSTVAARVGEHQAAADLQ